MPARTKGPKRPSKSKPKAEDKGTKRKRENDDHERLQKAIDEIDPKSSSIVSFADLPLCEATASGLKASHFETLTDVQARAIPAALKGNDLLAAAKTGSGKTLAFLIPVLEKLYHARWTTYDGLGALIISPTRELAVQIFDVLRKIGRYHDFSAGLVIGGKSLKEEAERIDRMNILVCTPGRMLQHLDQSFGLKVDDLQVLVLDEADRCMDMGFQGAMDALVEHLPQTRQTLLFSATQSKKVSDLARLSLKDPEYVSVHEAAESATPTSLEQHYIVTPLSEKLDTLYSFIRSSLKSKIVVFLSSGKQVRFVYETFRQLQPGIPLLHLHGRQKQEARMRITHQFTSARHSCLFATDVVARGVDFPAVDWVIQVDCPEDADTYIHRVGRTARYQSKGRAVLFLDPSEEEGMLKRLEHKKIPIQKINVKENKKKSIRNQLQSMAFKQPDIKYLAQKAFVTYVRSIYLQRDKEIFDMNKLDLDAYAASLGLPGTPQIKMRKGEDIKKIKNAPRMNLTDSEEDTDGEGKKPKKEEVRTKVQKMFDRTNQDILSSHYRKMVGEDVDDDDEEDFLVAKRTLNDDDLDKAAQNGAHDGQVKIIDFGGDQQLIVDSKRREKLLKSKKKLLKFKGHSQKLVFDDDGVAHPIYELLDEDEFKQQGPVEEMRRQFVEEEAGKVQEADIEDKELAKQKRKEKRERRKALERMERGEGSGPAGPVAQLEGVDGDTEDPLALLRSLPTNGGDYSETEEEVERPAAKKQKKWFQNDSDVEDDQQQQKKKKGKKDKGKKVIEAEEPETLEDLEALAAGLLDQ
ncbi:ATP-dependent RNA helicase dbp-4 [Cytospora mali]|uniref:ATP-dependent RNA helicase n=1 Tax=Cytospora mali TaxID=578113 RepID=A0A194UW50_CYTMA|nr:ATP-dependent RNA helicase dbp-4 [Valsa mali var. pyri (nom. inval.)]